MFSKIKSALAEDRTPLLMSREVEAPPRQPVATPVETPLSQPLKLRFKLSSDVVGESSVSQDVSKETIAAAPVAPVEWPSGGGGHSSHKKKKRHKKEKKKKKKKYHDRYFITCIKLSVIVNFYALSENLGKILIEHAISFVNFVAFGLPQNSFHQKLTEEPL